LRSPILEYRRPVGGGTAAAPPIAGASSSYEATAVASPSVTFAIPPQPSAPSSSSTKTPSASLRSKRSSFAREDLEATGEFPVAAQMMVSSLKVQIEQLRSENALLKQRVDELERERSSPTAPRRSLDAGSSAGGGGTSQMDSPSGSMKLIPKRPSPRAHIAHNVSPSASGFMPPPPPGAPPPPGPGPGPFTPDIARSGSTDNYRDSKDEVIESQNIKIENLEAKIEHLQRLLASRNS
jgi:hypothetical protein